MSIKLYIVARHLHKKLVKTKHYKKNKE